MAYLNSDNLQLQEVQIKISRAIDYLITLHRNDKGIIHTTSYKQLDFIKENISQANKCRIVETQRDRSLGTQSVKKIERDGVISEHFNTRKPTVLKPPQP